VVCRVELCWVVVYRGMYYNTYNEISVVKFLVSKVCTTLLVVYHALIHLSFELGYNLLY
jgi:hypothetical protein